MASYSQSTTRRTPFVLSLVSIALVLFFLGFFAVLVLVGKSAVDEFRAERPLKLMLNDGTTEAQAKQLLAELQGKPYVRRIEYQSPDDALREMRDVGDDFLKAMDNFNPLPSNIQIYLKDSYINGSSVLEISREVLQQPIVYEVVYPVQLIEQVDRNVRVFTQIGAPIAAVFLIITYLLVFNTIRLAIYSKRFVIRSMQLVGATGSFIRGPFLRMGVLQGVLAGLLASGGLFGLLLFLSYQMNNAFNVDLRPLANSSEIRLLYLALVVTGLVLGWLASRLAVNRYLNRSLDQIA